MKHYVLAVLILGLSNYLKAQLPGDLDPSFDMDGMQTAYVGPSADVARSILVQPDGKILVSGYSIITSVNTDFSMVRFNTDGSLDNSFHFDGRQTTSFTSAEDYAYAMALQTDGKIILAGYIANDYEEDFALLRYNSDGTLDTTFDGDGQLLTDFDGRRDYCFAVAIQTDGKIVAAGESTDTSNFLFDFAVARYNPDGSLDTNFDNDGKAMIDFFGSYDHCNSIAIQWDNKIILGGYSHGIGADFALVRLNVDGSMDNSFDFDGKVLTDFGAAGNMGYSVAVQPDRKIILAGQTMGISDGDFAVVRYNPEGSLDTTFGTQGLTTANLLAVDVGNAVVLQPDGKIVVAGIANLNFGVVRCNYNGSLDTTFSGDGIVVTDFGGLNDDAYAVALQPDGKIVVAGASDVHAPINDYAVARYFPYNATGITSSDLNKNSIRIYPNPVYDECFLSIATDDIQKIRYIQIINIYGEVIYQQLGNFTGFNRLYLNQAAPGLYFLQITTHTGQHSYRLIVQ